MLDRDVASFIQTGVSISLAACGPDRVPSINRGLGCKVLDGGARVAVFVRRSQAEALLACIRSSRSVANVFSLPSTNRTVQLKGVDASVVPFEAADLAVVQAHLDDFVREVLPMGISEEVVHTLLDCSADDLATVVYSPSAVFSQTPGPRAGEAIGGAS